MANRWSKKCASEIDFSCTIFYVVQLFKFKLFMMWRDSEDFKCLEDNWNGQCSPESHLE